MEVLGFYWPNIIAGTILVFVLASLGRHLVARNQSMEVMLLGQEFQTGILVTAFLISLFESGEHKDHGVHLEAILSIGTVIVFHSLFMSFVRKQRRFRIEGAIAFLILLMGLGHMVVLLSPIVEFHMVKGYLGDIVTVSKMESVSVAVLSVCFYLVFLRSERAIRLDTLEIALFNKVTKKRSSQLVFNILVLLLMLMSTHLFGSIFTVGAMILPAFISAIFGIDETKFKLLSLINSLTVPVAFISLVFFERAPTTVVILFLVSFISTLLSLVFRGRIK